MAKEVDQETMPGATISQTNQQTLHLHVHNLPPTISLAGRVEGVVLLSEGEVPLPETELHLFFGPVGEHPVATTRTDSQGAFLFADLPPGFYGLRLCLGHQVVLVHNLRVMPGESCQPRLVLFAPVARAAREPERPDHLARFVSQP